MSLQIILFSGRDIHASHCSSSFAGSCASIHSFRGLHTHTQTHTHTHINKADKGLFSPATLLMNVQGMPPCPPVPSSSHPIKSKTELIRPPAVRFHRSQKRKTRAPTHVVLHTHAESNRATIQAPPYVCFCHVAPCMQSIPDMQVSR